MMESSNGFYPPNNLEFNSPEDVVLDFCKNNLKTDFSILLCVSGGADSVALYHLFKNLKHHLSCSKMAVAHVNHGLRAEESDEDEQFVKMMVTGEELYIKRLKHKRPGESGIEEWARKERYKFFTQLKQKHRFDYIATAHTADDQAETVLMRIMRGSGIRGLRSILPVRNDGVIRPLLNVKRAMLIEWLSSTSLAFRTDSSNYDISFKRNWLRQEVLPVIKKRESQVIEHLCGFAQTMREINSLVEENINIWIQSHVIAFGTDCIHVSKKGFEKPVVASNAMVVLFEKFGIPVQRDHIQRVLDTAQKKSGEEFLLPGHWLCYADRHNVVLCPKNDTFQPFSCVLKSAGHTECKEGGAVFEVRSLPLPGENPPSDNKTVWLNVQDQYMPLIYRTIVSDDRFWPLGATKETKLADFLAKQGILKRERKRIGVVTTCKGEVVWVPGVRISEKFRVKPGCRKIIFVSFKSILSEKLQ
ncbi:tRNA lysidine(34) synthetase TilS [Chitinispirillales bacterium ANBcel5]|uniref:tRNA lysidine(34) synthetase TilS n=1 Tax=Cellulosispirillum alkaliphilum TaxID=3039283 RepID=UPI002A56DE15|nr:tRNA lysidine(34) synthetase TilS [Chitinispirillales bacterium ANBcel5]